MRPDLSPEERSELERDLEALRDELAELLAGSREAAKPVALDQPIGRVSRVDAIQQQKMVQATREGMARRAELVRAALGRFRDGSYGVCRSCEENIAFARLKARPETPLCIACQSGSESR